MKITATGKKLIEDSAAFAERLHSIEDVVAEMAAHRFYGKGRLDKELRRAWRSICMGVSSFIQDVPPIRMAMIAWAATGHDIELLPITDRERRELANFARRHLRDLSGLADKVSANLATIASTVFGGDAEPRIDKRATVIPFPHFKTRKVNGAA